MLGVRRTTLSFAIDQREAEGMISSRRGSLEVVGREVLERGCCECAGRTHPILGDELRALRRLQREQEPKLPFVFTSERGAPCRLRPHNRFTREEARRIAANIAKLPGLLKRLEAAG
jgi:DNA-binding transcriptional MocR family regulator